MLDEQLVERAVLLAVHGLLADEAGDRASSASVTCDAVLLDGLDEEPLALGEQQRERVQERRGRRDRPRTSRGGPRRDARSKSTSRRGMVMERAVVRGVDSP